jgi:hypothetical protein
VQERIQEITTRYESEYDVFDSESENYSEDVLDDLQSLYSGYGSVRQIHRHGSGL